MDIVVLDVTHSSDIKLLEGILGLSSLALVSLNSQSPAGSFHQPLLKSQISIEMEILSFAIRGKTRKRVRHAT
jgi:hypothetical protein